MNSFSVAEAFLPRNVGGTSISQHWCQDWIPRDRGWSQACGLDELMIWRELNLLLTADMLQDSIVTQSTVTPESMSVFLSIIFIIRQVVWMARWSFSTFTACRKRRHRVQLCSSLLLWMPQESKFVRGSFINSYGPIIYQSVIVRVNQKDIYNIYIVPICLYSTDISADWKDVSLRIHQFPRSAILCCQLPIPEKEVVVYFALTTAK